MLSGGIESVGIQHPMKTSATLGWMVGNYVGSPCFNMSVYTCQTNGTAVNIMLLILTGSTEHGIRYFDLLKAFG